MCWYKRHKQGALYRGTEGVLLLFTLLQRTGTAVEVCKTATVLQLVGIIFLMALLPRSVLVCTNKIAPAQCWQLAPNGAISMEGAPYSAECSTLPSTTFSNRKFLPLTHSSTNPEKKFPRKMRKIPPAAR